LLLVRHGESVAQAEGFVGGPKGCRGLSELGRSQVMALRDRWRAVGQQADVLVTSTLPRAVQTAEILNDLWGVPLEQDNELCEIVPGECDGMRWTEFESQFRGGDYRWDPYTSVSAGGESWVEFQERVSSAIGALVDRHHDKTIVAAVHGGVIDGSMVHFLGLPKDAGHVLQSTNASITEWQHVEPAETGEPGGWRLLRFNDSAHLE
jgi:probable phosphoglycerate mutase